MSLSHDSDLRIGTSGIVLPGPKSTFPAEFMQGTRLQYYASLFNTLEINSSFYKIPMPSTFEKWAGEVPDHFRFTVKLWRGITHERKLAYATEDIDRFMRAANFLGDKRGCLLVQFPASITIEFLPAVEKMLSRLAQLNEEGQWRLAIELRHISWYQGQAYTLFEKYKTSVVVHDMPASKTPLDVPVKHLVYLRFHGPRGDYKGSYNDAFIQAYANRIKSWQQAGKEVYAYFNNTMEGALDNARLLQKWVCLASSSS